MMETPNNLTFHCLNKPLSKTVHSLAFAVAISRIVGMPRTNCRLLVVPQCTLNTFITIN